MAEILVRNVSDETLKALKEKASRNRRSLQQEVLRILEECAREEAASDPARVAERIRSRLARSGRVFTDSTPLIREDRDR